MDDVRCHFYLGGVVREECVEFIDNNIRKDLRYALHHENRPLKDKLKNSKPWGHLNFDVEARTENGELRHTEDYCELSGIAFSRYTEPYPDNDRELRMFIPGVVNHNYIIDVANDPVVLADPFINIQQALRSINLKNAPLHINAYFHTHSDYAKHLLAGGTDKDFILDFFKKNLPPPIPELPPLRVIKQPKISFKSK